MINKFILFFYIVYDVIKIFSGGGVMKKRFLMLVISLFICNVCFSQVLQSTGVQNNLWTGMGIPSGVPNDENRDGFRWYGFIDSIQARVDVGIFTIDGMLAWGALTEWNQNKIDDFTFANTALKPEHFLHRNTPSVNDDSGIRSNSFNSVHQK